MVGPFACMCAIRNPMTLTGCHGLLDEDFSFPLCYICMNLVAESCNEY